MSQMNLESKSMLKRTCCWAKIKIIIMVFVLKIPCCWRIWLRVLVFDEIVHVDFFHLLENGCHEALNCELISKLDHTM